MERRGRSRSSFHNMWQKMWFSLSDGICFAFVAELQSFLAENILPSAPLRGGHCSRNAPAPKTDKTGQLFARFMVQALSPSIVVEVSQVKIITKARVSELTMSDGRALVASAKRAVLFVIGDVDADFTINSLLATYSYSCCTCPQTTMNTVQVTPSRWVNMHQMCP